MFDFRCSMFTYVRKSNIENKKNAKKLLIAVFFCLFPSIISAQGYKIDGRIRGLKDSTCYLTYYYENQNFVQDSTVASSFGEINFLSSIILIILTLPTKGLFKCRFYINPSNIISTNWNFYPMIL